MDLLIPAAGLGTRMRGLPKFLLPIDNVYKTLLENHIELSLIHNKHLKNIFIATRPEFLKIIESLGIDSKKIKVLTMETSTMNDTILNLLQYSDSEFYQLIMPDTYFTKEQPYGKLTHNPEFCDLAIWEIRKEQRGKLGEVEIDQNNKVKNIVDKDPKSNFKYSWGAMTFNSKLKKYINPLDPHIGYAIKSAIINKETITTKIVKGKYFDCGTPEEYLNLLKEELL